MDNNLLQLSQRIDHIQLLLVVVGSALSVLAFLGACLMLRLYRKRDFVGEIVLRGRSGGALLSLGVDEGGQPRLNFWQDDQRLSLSIGTFEDGFGTGLSINDTNGKTRILLGTSPEGVSTLSFWDEAGGYPLQFGETSGKVGIYAASADSGDRDLLARVASLEKANRAYLGSYQHALRYWSRVKGADSEHVAGTLLRLGSIKHDLGELDEAESLYRRALAIWEKSMGPESEAAAGCHLNMGLVSLSRGDTEEAEARIRRSLEIREKLFGPDHSEVAESISVLVRLHSDRDQFVEAEMLQRRVVEIWRRVLGADHPELARHLEYHASLLQWLAQGGLPHRSAREA